MRLGFKGFSLGFGPWVWGLGIIGFGLGIWFSGLVHGFGV